MIVVDDVAGARSTRFPDVDAVHVHFTDRLFGANAAIGADEFVALARTLGKPVSVTLHDVPQLSDGSSLPMRADAYRRVVDAAAGVVVSSDHERRLLARFTRVRDGIDVVPLVLDRSAPVDRPAPHAAIGVLGFIYPGKGHTEIIEALGGIDDDIALLAVGTVADGHDDMLADLQAQAARADVAFEATGFVPDSDLGALLRSVAVPVAFHRHISASSSINTWIGAGRRPLVPRNPYTAEIEANSPGTLWLHGDSVDDLRDAIVVAVTEPERTWTGDDVITFPSSQQVAAMYQKLFGDWSRR